MVVAEEMPVASTCVLAEEGAEVGKRGAGAHPGSGIGDLGYWLSTLYPIRARARERCRSGGRASDPEWVAKQRAQVHGIPLTLYLERSEEQKGCF